jgi:hypothetical protein
METGRLSNWLEYIAEYGIDQSVSDRRLMADIVIEPKHHSS